MNIEITHTDLEETRERIFFIVGTSRSGSTLLQSMLNSHSELVVPPETHFFHSYLELENRFQNSASKTQFRNKLIDLWYDQKTRIRDLGFDKAEVKDVADQLELETPLDLFTTQLTLYRKKRDKSIVGEKTPRHILKVKEIMKAYPKAKIISLFRDPRAASYSEIKADFGSPAVTVTTRRWRKYVKMHEQLQQELSKDRYMMLRYTDLIADVEAELQRVCDFLGVEFQESMLEYYKRDEKGFAEGEKSWKKGTLKPIQKNKNEEWKLALKDWQIVLVEETAGKYLKSLGYDKSGKSLSRVKKLFFQSVDLGRSAWATITRSRSEGYQDPRTFKF